jgi:hypothetical protein
MDLGWGTVAFFRDESKSQKLGLALGAPYEVFLCVVNDVGQKSTRCLSWNGKNERTRPLLMLRNCGLLRPACESWSDRPSRFSVGKQQAKILVFSGMFQGKGPCFRHRPHPLARLSAGAVLSPTNGSISVYQNNSRSPRSITYALLLSHRLHY